MKRSVLLKYLFTLSVVYLVCQFIIIPKLLEKKPPIEQFLQLFKDIPLFLLEDDILATLVESHNIVSASLLHAAPVITFGLTYIKTIVHKIRETRHQLQQNGFFCEEITSDIGTETLLSHLFIHHDTLLVHIVVFYPQTSSTVATFPIAPRDLRYINYLHGRSFVDYAHIFDRFQVHQRGIVSVPTHPTRFLANLASSKYIPCNITRAQAFLFKHPEDASDKAKHFKRKARQIIARAKQYLDDLQIPFWLSSGTCLGWFRQCDIITYSQDVDLGILIEHYRPELIPTFERGGFFLKNIFGKVSDSYELSFQAGDIKVDLFFFYNETDHIWNGGTDYLTGQKLKYIFPPFSMCWTIFLELKVRVPCPPQTYIEANYGSDWMEPVQDWQWDKSPPNVQHNGYWPKQEMEEVIQVY